jgi:hypothetical protein
MTTIEAPSNPGSFAAFSEEYMAACEATPPYADVVAAYGKVVTQYRGQLEEYVDLVQLSIPEQASA